MHESERERILALEPRVELARAVGCAQRAVEALDDEREGDFNDAVRRLATIARDLEHLIDTW